MGFNSGFKGLNTDSLFRILPTRGQHLLAARKIKINSYSEGKEKLTRVFVLHGSVTQWPFPLQKLVWTKIQQLSYDRSITFYKASSSDSVIYWFFFEVLLSAPFLQVLSLLPRLPVTFVLTLSFLHDVFCNTLLTQNVTRLVWSPLFIDQNL